MQEHWDHALGVNGDLSSANHGNERTRLKVTGINFYALAVAGPPEGKILTLGAGMRKIVTKRKRNKQELQ